ncbi:MAG: 50S ribosomal protein L9 [Zetaproteobacteria bacterium]|nr:50S ribosomal protein L9 [Zetaproteobacteria bacterium]
MQLILLERVDGLGNVGDEVGVKAGYGRNFLLPQEKAIVANEGNRKIFERRRSVLEEKHQDELGKAQMVAGKLAELELSVIRATSDGKNLYGSVSSTDLASLLSDTGYDVQRRFILLDEQIKTVGEHTFRVRLHPDVTADMAIKVEAESL